MTLVIKAPKSLFYSSNCGVQESQFGVHPMRQVYGAEFVCMQCGVQVFVLSMLGYTSYLDPRSLPPRDASGPAPLGDQHLLF